MALQRLHRRFAAGFESDCSSSSSSRTTKAPLFLGPQAFAFLVVLILASSSGSIPILVEIATLSFSASTSSRRRNSSRSASSTDPRHQGYLRPRSAHPASFGGSFLRGSLYAISWPGGLLAAAFLVEALRGGLWRWSYRSISLFSARRRSLVNFILLYDPAGSIYHTGPLWQG